MASIMEGTWILRINPGHTGLQIFKCGPVFCTRPSDELSNEIDFDCR